MKSIIKVGVTGGIGSGKSFICRTLKFMGYPIFFSDQASKSILIEDAEVRIKVKNLLGDSSYISDQEINRKFIASKIFTDNELLKQMNAIIHPAVRIRFEKWAYNQNSEIAFNEAAILFETDGYQHLDKNILVTASLDTKIRRIQNRDQISIEEIKKRMSNQWDDDQKIGLADYIISNNDGEMLLPQIIEVLDDLKSLLPN